MANLLLDPLAIATEGMFSLTAAIGGTAAPPVRATRLDAIPRAVAIAPIQSATKVCS
jgi:hypothetical protein